jgi:hypothetical protein
MLGAIRDQLGHYPVLHNFGYRPEMVSEPPRLFISHPDSDERF